MKKKTIVRIAAIVLAITAFSVFGMFVLVESPQEAEAADTRAAVSAEETEKQGKKETKAGEAETPVKGEETPMQEKKTNGDSQQVQPKAKKQETSAAANQSAVTGKSEKEDKDTQGGGETGKAEANETKPVHTHDWQEFYETVSKEIYGDKCKGCIFSTNEAGAIYEHIDKDPFDNCGSYATGVVIRTCQVKEFAGYRCSCGATK